jgi:uncharacterized SAM-binding protein YcdF (DUF218 family)
VVAAAAVVTLAWGEWTTWRASRRGIPAGRMDASVVVPGEVVVVLGFASSADGRANAIQRWRVRIAVRSTDRRTATFVFTGAAVHGPRSEAWIMAQYAITSLGVPAGNVVLEERARTTWENVSYCIPLLVDAPAIKIASNTFHARRAREYLAKQSPALAARLRRAADYRLGELTPVKPLLVVSDRVRALFQR